MAKKKTQRLILGLVCPVCKNRNYVTSRNRVNTEEKLKLKKYCRRQSIGNFRITPLPDCGSPIYPVPGRLPSIRLVVVEKALLSPALSHKPGPPPQAEFDYWGKKSHGSTRPPEAPMYSCVLCSNPPTALALPIWARNSMIYRDKFLFHANRPLLFDLFTHSRPVGPHSI